eukprot:SAG31_NODE_1850_length_7082_cov_7.264786_2_plen_106_part_00
MGEVGENTVHIEVGSSRNTVHARIRVSSIDSPVVVIALHPWSVMGGSLHDPHPSTVCELMGAAGFSTARLNFRSGIGTLATPDSLTASVTAILVQLPVVVRQHRI